MSPLRSHSRTRCSNAVLSLAFALLPALFTAGHATAADTTRLGLHRIHTYEVISDKVIIIQANRKKSYRVDLLPGCFGLRHAHTLGFQTRGGNSLDKFSSVVLPDGTRCRFKSITYVPQLPEVPLQGNIQAPETTGAIGAAAD